MFGRILGSEYKGYKKILLRIFGYPVWHRRSEARITSRWISNVKNKLILDVACLNGLFSFEFADKGSSVVGIDINREAIQNAQQRTKYHKHLDVSFILADSHFLPLNESIFDFVFCNCSLEHFENDIKALNEMRLVVKPKKRIVLTMDSFKPRISIFSRIIPSILLKKEVRILENEFRDRTKAMKKYHERNHHVVRFYTPNSITKKLEYCGFKIIDFRYYHNRISGIVFEAHILSKFLDFTQSIVITIFFPIFYLLTFVDNPKNPGYGLAVFARKSEQMS